jgi:hypothetical protein
MKRVCRESIVRLSFGLAAVLLILTGVFAQMPSDSRFTIWRFDNIDSIGGHATHVLGHPYLIDSPYGCLWIRIRWRGPASTRGK